MLRTILMPLVSVIIPTYNRILFLKEAIASVLSQDFRDFELIVVDDGSNDETHCVINNEYSSSIKYIYQKHHGVSAARNRGILNASGELIAFLDSDDLWFPDKLYKQIVFFENNPDALICQTEEIWIRNGIRVNPKKYHKKYSGNIFKKSLPLCIVSPSAVMMRKELFDRVGLFDETLPVCEDYDLWLRVSAQYFIYLIETPLIIKRGGHTDQLSKSREEGCEKFRIQALGKILNSNTLNQEQFSSAFDVLKNKCLVYGTGCLKRGKISEGHAFLALPESFNRNSRGSKF
ncbi:MAG: glycosyltransferase [Pseudomonadota bacterium]